MDSKITLYANDSSYAGISFISDKIDANVLLFSSVRKDFDDMITNKVYYKDKSKFIQILNNTEHLIIFGVISLKRLFNLFGIDYIKRFNKCSLIISDTTYVKEYTKWNDYIIKYKIDILIMPDLIKYLNKKIKYRPYFQHIDIKNYKLNDKNTVFTISHSPGLKFKTDLKGTSLIKKILHKYNLDIIYGNSWEECIKRKSKSHIFIDQIVEEKNYKGGLGKSGLESMLLGCLTITSGKPLITEPFFENPPIILATSKNLKEIVDYYFNNKTEYIEMVNKQQSWAMKYLNSDFVINNILNKKN